MDVLVVFAHTGPGSKGAAALATTRRHDHHDPVVPPGSFDRARLFRPGSEWRVLRGHAFLVVNRPDRAEKHTEKTRSLRTLRVVEAVTSGFPGNG